MSRRLSASIRIEDAQFREEKYTCMRTKIIAGIFSYSVDFGFLFHHDRFILNLYETACYYNHIIFILYVYVYIYIISM